ncbi:uncharacterized protein FTOL_08538 [Fusarium torulosum]|uniref:Uncharacterized protein n=1 Tax=Fusarium torulosum TaxID=33205 RepID=A0AAE8MFF1_9HYPO|nr:uncharacterized protein FTOL_08538 [Fusarium torulosum]
MESNNQNLPSVVKIGTIIATREAVTRAIIVSFIPELSIQAEMTYMRILRTIQNDHEGTVAFDSTHWVRFFNLAHQQRSFNPVTDILLTSNMMLPEPRFLAVFRNLGLCPISLPFQRVASVYYGKEIALVVDLRRLWKTPLNLKVLPHLQEFTMLCLENNMETILDLYSDQNDSNVKSRSRMETITEETPEAGKSKSIKELYGFRYYPGTHLVQFTQLTWPDIKEIALALAGSSPQTGAIPSTIVRLWIMTRENEMRHNREPDRQWTDLSMNSEFENPSLNKTRKHDFCGTGNVTSSRQ